MAKPKKPTKYEKLVVKAWDKNLYAKLFNNLFKLRVLNHAMFTYCTVSVAATIRLLDDRAHDWSIYQYNQEDIKQNYKYVKSIKPTKTRS